MNLHFVVNLIKLDQISFKRTLKYNSEKRKLTFSNLILR